jgi:Zn ribbon nucleic-acid-binding protein
MAEVISMKDKKKRTVAGAVCCFCNKRKPVLFMGLGPWKLICIDCVKAAKEVL